MIYKTQRLPIIYMIGMALFGLGGCHEVSPGIPDVPDDEPEGPMMTICLKNLAASSPEENKDVELFQFAEGKLKKKLVAPVYSEENPLVFTKLQDSRIYAVSGYSVDAREGETDEETFLHTTVSVSADATSAPIFYSSVTEVGEDDRSLDIEMMRGVARIDVKNADPDLVIESVVVSDVPVSSYIFPIDGKVFDSERTSFSRSFSEGLTGTEKGVFTVYESAVPVTLTIRGTVKGESYQEMAEIPAVVRNKVYTLRLTPDEWEDPGDKPVKVKPVITVSDWEDADGPAVGPNTEKGLGFDPDLNQLPANVSYDAATGVIHLPASGLEDFRLSFKSDMRVDIDTIMLSGPDVERDGLIGKACTVRNRTVVENGNDIITTYSLKVLPQLICRAEYKIDLRIRKASMVSGYDYVNLIVAAHPKQIQTVKIGGREWMCFNAMSTELEDQIFPIEGTSIDEMYNEHFVDCIGNYFQYGKENPFSPWTSNDPNQFADQTRDIPWQTAGRMPLPEGYHVASANDWKALMPNGITLPDTWETESGETIKGTVVTLPGTLVTTSANVNKQNFLMRYVLFESLTTGAKLYVPIAGLKSNNNAEIPGVGAYKFHLRSAYWIMEDRYIWLIDYKATADKEDGAVLQQNRWNYDGFLLVRGVKD